MITQFIGPVQQRDDYNYLNYHVTVELTSMMANMLHAVPGDHSEKESSSKISIFSKILKVANSS